MNYKCVLKYRDKNNNIVGYKLASLENKQVCNVTPQELKQAIQKQSVKITNLKLTSDNKLIDKDDTLENVEQCQNINTNNIISILDTSYKPKSLTEENQNKYIARKFNSKRVGKSMARALLIGMACLSLSGTLTGCGTQEVNTKISVEAKEDKQTVMDIIESASEINININRKKYDKEYIVSVDKNEIASLYGEAYVMSDDIELSLYNGQTLNKGSKSDDTILNIYDSDSNIKYKIIENKVNNIDAYEILDASGLSIAYMDKNVELDPDEMVYIYNSNGDIIVEIDPATLITDFTIRAYDNCDIDNIDLVTICTNYMRERFHNSVYGNTRVDSNGTARGHRRLSRRHR